MTYFHYLLNKIHQLQEKKSPQEANVLVKLKLFHQGN